MTREQAIDLLDNLIGMVEDNHCSDYDSALRMAIADMEKQIPKMVINEDRFYDYCECPSCKSVAVDSVGCMYGYCRKCGQRLKSSEERG